MNLSTYDKDVSGLLGAALYEAILDEVDVGRINQQKMDDVALQLSPKVFGGHKQRGGCDEAEMRRILNCWFEEMSQGQGLDKEKAIAHLEAVFKHRSVRMYPMIKKLKRSQGVRRALGELDYEKLRQAAKSGEFSRGDCTRFAYQISTGVAATVNQDISKRTYGPQTVDAMLEDWYGCPHDEISLARMVNILKDPAVGKASLAQKFMEARLPSVENPVDVGEEMEEYDRLGAIPKRKEESVSNVSRRDSIIDQAKGNYSKLKQRFQRWRGGASASETNAFERALRTSQRENDRLRNALRTSQRENENLRNDQVSKKDPDFKTLRNGFDPKRYICDTSIGSEAFIGRGFFGRVYKASLRRSRDETELQPSEVALKVVPLSDDEFHMKYQQKEMDFFNQFYRNNNFCHPNIINYLGFTDYMKSKTHCIYMELCQYTLAKSISDGISDPDTRANFILHVTHGICSGVTYLHSLGIIHRDIAPTNILLKEGPEDLPTVKVADFNTYAVHDKDRREDQTHTADVGQRHYRAKEVRMLMEGTRKAVYGCGADVWSIGTVVYEMATRSIFNDLADKDFWSGNLFVIHEKLSKNVQDDSLKNFLSKCLQWEPSARCRCFELLQDDFLRRGAEGDPGSRDDCGVSRISVLSREE